MEAETYIGDIKLQKLIKNETIVLQEFFCKIDRFGNNSIMVKVLHRTSKIHGAYYKQLKKILSLEHFVYKFACSLKNK